MKFKLLVLALLLLVHAHTSFGGPLASGPKCQDDSWVRGQEGQTHLCFKALPFPKLPSTFATGKSLCESIGAFAAPFRGENDRLAIKAAIDKTNYKKSSSRWLGFYLGIRNVATSRTAKGDFRNEHDSSPISYTTWSPPNPNMENGFKHGWEQCVIAEVNNNLNWNDALCDHDPALEHIGIVCAKKATMEAPASSQKKPIAPPIEQKIAVAPVEAKPIAPPAAKKMDQTKAGPSCEDASWVRSLEGETHLCFKAIPFSKLPSTFANGKVLCDSVGAFAAPFRGANDRVAIQAAIDKTNYKKTASRWLGFFIGIRNVAKSRTAKGDFRNEHDSSSISYSAWSPENPNMGDWVKDGWEQCVVAEVNNNLDWNDALCDTDSLQDHIGIVCAKKTVGDASGPNIAEMKPVVSNAEKKLVPPTVEQKPRTKNCK